MNARSGWNAAKLASERPLPKPRKMHGPVGAGAEGPYPTDACEDCGHHMCSCKPPVAVKPVSTEAVRDHVEEHLKLAEQAQKFPCICGRVFASHTAYEVHSCYAHMSSVELELARKEAELRERMQEKRADTMAIQRAAMEQYYGSQARSGCTCSYCQMPKPPVG